MHHQFEAGLIVKPPEYRDAPLLPAAGLSEIDMATARRLYPPREARLPELRPFESQRIDIGAGDQVDLAIRLSLSRQYTLTTLGDLDTVMVLFETHDGVPSYIDGDDDSGLDLNSQIVARMERDREYVVRIRLYFAAAQGQGAVLLY